MIYTRAFLRIFIMFVFVLFTVLPEGLLYSVVEHDRFVVLTPPKAGTHLLTKILGLMLKKQHFHYPSRSQDDQTLEGLLQLIERVENNNQFFDGHVVTPEFLDILQKNNYKIISLLRDPRDQLLSIRTWILEGRWPYLPTLEELTPEEQIDELILGTRYGWRAFEGCFLNTFSMPLIMEVEPTTVYISRFENLVGSDGGGDKNIQIEEILSLAAHIGVELGRADAEEIGEKAFGDTMTFRDGKIGSWRHHFSYMNKEVYKTHYGELLIDWSYENDFDW